MRYLGRDFIREAYAYLRKEYSTKEEPLPVLSPDKLAGLDAISNCVFTEFFGYDPYPRLSQKAAILMYRIAKGHPFENGNKRMSVFISTLFLIANEKMVVVSDEEFKDKALEVSKSDPLKSEDVIRELANWLETRLADIPKALIHAIKNPDSSQ